MASATTVAMEMLLLAQVTVRSVSGAPLASLMVAVTVTLWLTSNEVDAVATETLIALLPGCVESLLQPPIATNETTRPMRPIVRATEAKFEFTY